MLVNLWYDICGSLAAFPTTGKLLEGRNPNGTTRERGAIAGARGSRIFCIPLLSGIIGVFQSKYLPIGDMTAGDLRLEMTLANAMDGVVPAGAVPLYPIFDVEMMP